MTRIDRVKMDVLIDKFSETCPFQPLGIFDLNFSNSVSMAGLSFTYVIVLLQFKIADRFSEVAANYTLPI